MYESWHVWSKTPPPQYQLPLIERWQPGEGVRVLACARCLATRMNGGGNNQSASRVCWRCHTTAPSVAVMMRPRA